MAAETALESKVAIWGNEVTQNRIRIGLVNCGSKFFKKIWKKVFGGVPWVVMMVLCCKQGLWVEKNKLSHSD